MWFRFHAVPGLPEQVIPGHEDTYPDWFFQHSTYQQRGIAPEARAFGHYRDFPQNRQQVADALAQGQRLPCPIMAVCGHVVGEVLFSQRRPITSELETHLLPGCGHAVPEEQPAAFARLI